MSALHSGIFFLRFRYLSMHEIPAPIPYPAHGGLGYALLPKRLLLIHRDSHIFPFPGFLVKNSL